MRASILALGAVALQQVSAWSYPDCEADGCYRNFVDERFAKEGEKFCVDFLSGTTTAASAIPTSFNNCAGDVKAVSSACSCITYTLTHTKSPATSTASVSKAVPTTTVTTSECEDETLSAKPTTSSKPHYTTSTVYYTKVYTITSCKPEVTDCPKNPKVTTVVESYTTVCPVEEEHPITKTKSYGTAAPTAKPTTTKTFPVTAAAGKVGTGFGAAAAALAVAALL